MSHGHVPEAQCVCVCLVKGQRCSGGGWLASSVIASWQSGLRNLSTSQAVRPFFCWLLFQASFVLVLPGAAASPGPSESVRSVLVFVALWNFLQPCDWTDRRGFLFVVLFAVVLFFSPQAPGHLPTSCGRMGELFVSHRKRRSLYQRRNANQAKTTDLHDNEASYLFSFNKCRNFAQAHIAKTGANAQCSRIQSIQNPSSEKKCQDCKTMFGIKTASGIPFFTTAQLFPPANL